MNKLFIAIVGSIIFAFNTNISHAGNWWDTDFMIHPYQYTEDNGSGTWGTFKSHGHNPHNPYHVGVVGRGHPVRAGAESIRFEVRPGQCGTNDCGWKSERSELIMANFDRPGNDTWYAWSIYHQNYKTLNGGVSPTHGQFKTMNGGHQYAFFIIEPRGMVLKMDEFEGVRPEVLIPASQLSNKWHDIRVHAKWSTGADGIFQVWVDGKMIVNRHGQNAINNDPIAFRFGLYRSQVNRASNNHTQVVFYDELMRGNSCQSVSQFMACDGNIINPSTGGGPGNGTQTPPANVGGGTTAWLEAYVNKYGDLLAAYNANHSGKTKAAWGHWHYCSYGKGEGRTSPGVTPNVCNTTLNSATPTINTTVNEAEGGGGYGDRFSSEITNGVKRFSKVAVFNSNIFSFKNYYTFTAFEVKDNQGLLLGFSKYQETDGTITDPIGIGWRFNNLAFMVAQDNSLLGYKAEGIFDFKDPGTTYIDLGYRKKFSENVTLFTDVIYAIGRSKEGDLVKLSNIHALGFESKLKYKATDKSMFVFRFDMPLHIEKGTSRFYVHQLGTLYELNIDMVPDGRQMNLGMNHIYQLTKSSNFTTVLSYTDDLNHRAGTNDYLAMVKYNINF